jgi:hypothetical protein
MSTADFPRRLTEKLRTIRERTGLTPDEIADLVHAPNGAAIVGYENGTDIPASVINAYARLGGIPLEKIVRDDLEV